MKTTQAALVALLSTTALSETRKVTITVDASTSQGPLTPLNQFFGCDEPNYAYYPHGSELLASLGNLSSTQTFFRTHNLLTTGPGYPAIKFGSTNAYTEDAAGGAVYNWTIVDRIFDAYLGNGVKPYAQIGFMPEAMALNPEPYYFTFDPVGLYA
jgi:xylan 1,4-beta-xylosidase